ncbi:tRNA-specific 2-thiouridylase MnmA [Mycena sanguinolenta]|uniref:tRNA-5-taurinomethyluridine 2-sulfurtransferase n=1 Tax=Mycena sanguinolenta TaxID=230812 RepID=A0A8H7DJK8_9AGAR|nr:tRNA-specific 2-thiouridylase MnmA [Mycena sanguinolenta]
MLCARAALKLSVARTYGARFSTHHYPQKGDRVVLGMSGGIDSSVSAKLLAAQDYDLSAVFMRNWDTRDEYGTSDKGCEWEKDWDDVQKVCKVYDIPCEMVDLSKEYWNRVFEPSLRMWEDGITPNPDVWCNREIKFGALFEHLPQANTAKPPWLATGHYARKDWSSSRPRLLRAADTAKDQSYYLSSIPQEGLSRALFPIGGFTKPEVRRIAQDGDMPTSVLEREESMGLCFIGEKKRTDFKEFISSYITPSPGPVKMLSTGRILSEHNGLWSFTIGEKIRLRGMPEKMYVAQKDIPTNTIFVAPGRDPSLLCNSVRVRDFSWIWRDSPPAGLRDGVQLSAQIRHRMRSVLCTVKVHDDQTHTDIDIVFDEPLKGVASGQVSALWDGDWCLGCGIITTAM